MNELVMTISTNDMNKQLITVNYHLYLFSWNLSKIQFFVLKVKGTAHYTGRC
jgi:hypothetical protein